jgi:hypothetical protein
MQGDKRIPSYRGVGDRSCPGYRPPSGQDTGAYDTQKKAVTPKKNVEQLEALEKLGAGMAAVGALVKA